MNIRTKSAIGFDGAVAAADSAAVVLDVARVALATDAAETVAAACLTPIGLLAAGAFAGAEPSDDKEPTFDTGTAVAGRGTTARETAERALAAVEDAAGPRG